MRKGRHEGENVSLETEEGTWDLPDDAATPHEELEKKEALVERYQLAQHRIFDRCVLLESQSVGQISEICDGQFRPLAG